MLIIAGGVLVCLALLWWLSGWSFGGSAVIATGELDEHSTIKRLIAQTKNEKAKSLLREVGKRSTMNNRNRLVPALLALVGVGLIAFGSIGTALPRLPVDLLKWLPSIQVTKYPDAAVIFLEEASERDMDFALVLANKAFTDSLASRSIEWRVLDDDQPEAAELVKVAKSPSMLFVKPLGGAQYEILATRDIPKSSKEANAMIAEVMGL